MAPPRRPVHDKTNPPTHTSPSRINSPSPSLSPSNSNSAGSSTEPTTPPSNHRGHTRKPFPESIGRVPLHRRGTSKTYERLEDLLREAGYKETRIFTPETERTVPPDEAKSPTIGAQFAGFLSNFVPSRSTSLKRNDEPEVIAPVYSPPTSPSLDRTPRPGSHATHNSTSQLPRRNLPTAVPQIGGSGQRPAARRGSNADYSSGVLSSRRRSVIDLQQQQQQRSGADIVSAAHHQPPPLHHPTPERPVNRYYQHHPSSSRSSGVTSPPLRPPVHHPTPTRASAYLRHMTSFDRPQSTPPTYTRITDDAEEESLISPTVPRMPTGWIDNVKRAREYFAPPAPLPPISASPVKSNATRLGRSVSTKTRGRLSDRTNAHAPPLLTTRISTSRAKRSESQVSVGRVMCRSRGSSPVRREKGKAREVDLNLRGRLELPDDDDLARSRFLGGWETAGAQLLLCPPRRRDADLDSSSDLSSEGEEEITLARILVPSLHQRPAAMERSRSVRSLRRCLELDGQAHSDVPPVPPLPNAGTGRWSLSLSWGRASTEEERRDVDDPEVYVNARKGSTRQRPVLPTWGN
ncbi:hypothetical protein GGX14DRAFT_603044 [Mycena pura]|uniref:Uncharacterized protein n=1 Tax=Mycena pura TaxID=153505 RepID=A0AAD6UMP2_9AGAR|nr:hypothetical protein GGX14DRAFT_603044 [Mycena pura]